MGVMPACGLLTENRKEILEVPSTETRAWQEATDMELVRSAQSGEIAPFEELVRRYRNEVFALSFHYVRNREDAWDISQEVFIKVHRSLQQFRGDSSFKTWLMRITSNQCKDFLKATRLKTVPLESEKLSAVIGSKESPREDLVHKEMEQVILEALDEMPFKHRTAFILREMEQLSYKDMAEIMGCNIGTVMSRLHHARKKIKQKLLKKGIVLE